MAFFDTLIDKGGEHETHVPASYGIEEPSGHFRATSALALTPQISLTAILRLDYLEIAFSIGYEQSRASLAKP
jgi:hypothetical protein